MVWSLPESVSINDAVGFGAAVPAAISATAIGSISLFGHSLSAEAFAGVSIAAVMYLAAFAVAWITNQRELDDFRDGRSSDRDPEEYLVLGAPALMLLHEFVPEVQNAVTGEAYIGTTVAIVLLAAYGLVAHY